MQAALKTDRIYTLDGIRGVAALGVFSSHASGYLPLFLEGRGRLAVDLFFLMSGVVLAHVYEPRFATGMTPRQFMLNRLTRLYPLYFLGTMLGVGSGLIALLIGKSNMGPVYFPIAVVFGLLMLPSPTWARAQPIMPLDNPGWSLFFEMVANIVFALIWKRLSNRLLLFCIAISMTILICGFFRKTGWGGPDWDGFLWGFPRVTFSFALGILIQRHCRGPKMTSHLAWVPLILVAWTILSPWPAGWLYEALCIFLIYPVIVIASILITPRAPTIFTFLGTLSYPLYITHYPPLSAIDRAAKLLHFRLADHMLLSGGVILGTIGLVAIAADHWFDRPVRRMLITRLSSTPRRDRVSELADTPL